MCTRVGVEESCIRLTAWFAQDTELSVLKPGNELASVACDVSVMLYLLRMGGRYMGLCCIISVPFCRLRTFYWREGGRKEGRERERDHFSKRDVLWEHLRESH